jgi:hypothetical protein
MRNKPARLILFSLFVLILILPNFTLPAQAQTASPSPRYGASLVNVDGRVFLYGGKINPEINESWEFDADSNEFQQLNQPDPKPAPRHGHAAVSVGGKMYIFGGQGAGGSLSDLWVYDPAANTWTQLQPTGKGPASVPHLMSSAVSVGTDIFVFDAWNGVFIYDTLTNTWKFGAPPPSEIDGFTVSVVNGQPVIFGGAGKDGASRAAYVYNPQQSTWQTVNCAGDWPGAAQPVSVGLGNSLFVLGGRREDNQALNTDLYQVTFDPATGACTAQSVASDPAYGRTLAAIVALPGSTEANPRLLIFGGRRDGAAVSDPLVIELGQPAAPTPSETPTYIPEPYASPYEELPLVFVEQTRQAWLKTPSPTPEGEPGSGSKWGFEACTDSLLLPILFSLLFFFVRRH